MAYVSPEIYRRTFFKQATSETKSPFSRALRKTDLATPTLGSYTTPTRSVNLSDIGADESFGTPSTSFSDYLKDYNSYWESRRAITEKTKTETKAEIDKRQNKLYGEAAYHGISSAVSGIPTLVNETARAINLGISLIVDPIAKAFGSDYRYPVQSITESVGGIAGSGAQSALELATGITAEKQSAERLNVKMQEASRTERTIASLVDSTAMMLTASAVGGVAGYATRATSIASATKLPSQLASAQRYLSALDKPTATRAAAMMGRTLSQIEQGADAKDISYSWVSATVETGLELGFGVFDEAAAFLKIGNKAMPNVRQLMLTVLKGAAGEGAEEAVQYVAQTGIDYLYYNEGQKFSDMFDTEQLIDSAIAGALGGAIFATVGAARSKRLARRSDYRAIVQTVSDLLDKPINKVTVDEMNRMMQIASDASTSEVFDAIDFQRKADIIVNGGKYVPDGMTETEYNADLEERRNNPINRLLFGETATERIGEPANVYAENPTIVSDAVTAAMSTNAPQRIEGVNGTPTVSTTTTRDGTKYVRVAFDRALSKTERALMKANGLAYDNSSKTWQVKATEDGGQYIINSMHEVMATENIDEIVDAVGGMFVEEDAGAQKSKKGSLNLGRKQSDKKTGYTPTYSEEVADSLNRARTVQTTGDSTTKLQRLAQMGKEFGQGSIPLDRKYADVRQGIMRVRASHGIANTVVYVNVSRSINKLSNEERALLADVFTLNDAYEDIALGTIENGKLPFGFESVEEIETARDAANAALEKNPSVQKAYDSMLKTMDNQRQTIIKKAKNLNIDLSWLNNRKHYMAHAVLEYVSEMKRVNQRGAERFMRRHGTDLDYLTDPAVTYYIGMHKLYSIDAKLDLLASLTPHDIADQLKIQTGYDAGKIRNADIPDGYEALTRIEMGIGLANHVAESMARERMKSVRNGFDERIQAKRDLLDEDGIQSDKARIAQIEKEISDLQLERTAAMEKEYANVVENTDDKLVLPSEIAQAIKSEFADTPRSDSKIVRGMATTASTLTKAWKMNTLLNPSQVFKYNMKNLFGDADALLYTYPKAFTKIRQAARELKEFRINNKITKDMAKYIEFGGLTAGLSAVTLDEVGLEIGSMPNLQEKSIPNTFNSKTGFDKAVYGATVPIRLTINGIKGYFNTVSELNQYREQLLRYATFLHLNEAIDADIKKGGIGLPRFHRSNLANYGAAVPSEIRNVSDPSYRAFLLTQHALGFYEDVSLLGQKVSKYAMPFYRFQEVNLMRYFRMFKNSFYNDADVTMSEGYKTATKFMKGAKVTAFTAYRLGRIIGLTFAWRGVLSALNKLLEGEDEDLLPEYVRNSAHLGFVIDGKAYYYTDLSSFGTLLNTFGFDRGKFPFITDVRNLIMGQTTVEDLLAETTENAYNNAFNMITPFAKALVELPQGKTFFPSVSDPTSIEDKWEYLFSLFDLDGVYKAIINRPSAGGKSFVDISTSFANSVVMKDSATWRFAEIKDDFFASIGDELPDVEYSDKGANKDRAEALYYLKKAIQFEDENSALYYLAKYASLGGTKKSYDASMRSWHPLFNVPTKYRKQLLDWMDEDQMKVSELALENYNDMIKQGQDVWGSAPKLN